MKLSDITSRRNATFQELFADLELRRTPQNFDYYTAAYSILRCEARGTIAWQAARVVREYKGAKAFALIKRVADYIKRGEDPDRAAYTVLTVEGQHAYSAAR